MYAAIIYRTCSGSCERYAKLLSEELGIPAFRLGRDKVRTDLKVVYIGWLFAGKIVGFKSAVKKFNIGAVVQVGMSPVTEESEAKGRSSNPVSADVPLFSLQGGFDMRKLPFYYRLIMKPITASIAEKLEAKSSLTEQEKATLSMAKNGVGEPASWDVSDIVEWCRAH